ncbi:site-specific integrase [Leptolyngbya sp. FACHB-261]|uniref:site-specific integrase n=1 Tax=Leptolyngbya sp. FACHB-261 TaxID=2692806 RepID=UPI0028C3959C|nr:site-specific integrase [Leptolyngbya sp. FACHB-261]
MRLRHFSLRTEKSYIYYIRDFILFQNKRHPKDVGADEIRSYLSHLALERNVSASTDNLTSLAEVKLSSR